MFEPVLFIFVKQVFQSVESQFTTSYICSFNDSNMSRCNSNTKLKKRVLKKDLKVTSFKSELSKETLGSLQKEQMHS